ncbi:MAG TPA: translation elongation factor Ts [Candidatus Krumholzibacteria bacterium]|jgi:elongation factor Ts|nr:translation elongation factor Ts [Candidatus Krumholzibacteria bacterium]
MSEDTKAVGAGVVKELRERTGAGMMDCKKALEESGGDVEKAIEFLRIKGLSKAAKKADREANEGLVMSYIHPGNRIGVLIEVNCETDFVARTDEFQALVRNLAMHVAAASPLGVNKEDISTDLLEKEKEVFKAQALEEGKPAAVIDKIIAGRIEKFYAEAALMEQVYVRDNEKRVKDLVNEAISKLGENIKVARFARFQLGQ